MTQEEAPPANPTQTAPTDNQPADDEEKQEVIDLTQSQQRRKPKRQRHFALVEVERAWEMVHNAYPEIHNLQNSILGESASDCLVEVANEYTVVKQLQNALTEQIETTLDEIRLKRMNPTDKARALCTREATAAFTCNPAYDHDDLTLQPLAAQHACQIRTGTLKITEGLCACGAERTPIHILSCKKMRGRFVRHDVIVRVLRKLCTEEGLVTTLEEMVIEGRQNRMDLVIHFPTKAVWVDASVVNPLARTYAKSDAKKRREREKRGKWGAWAEETGVQFVPFVMDIFGGLGAEAADLMKTLAQEAYLSFPYPTADSMTQWKAVWKRKAAGRLGVALAQCNSGMIVESNIKAVKPNASVGVLYRGAWKLGQKIVASSRQSSA